MFVIVTTPASKAPKQQSPTKNEQTVSHLASSFVAHRKSGFILPNVFEQSAKSHIKPQNRCAYLFRGSGLGALPLPVEAMLDLQLPAIFAFHSVTSVPWPDACTCCLV